ncbi:YicC/YloC family endoribonuclease [Parvularcula dongshanensis]|uniref:Uncharacterized protein (TIGR00255 family) n=1 Tax=Parvularcula dongshanensis TaxID=1173995 RepID=A0A840I848_9PROT|nr:YicC/YloC family endoribonuclease [Parvularcula dongshanensis]MBB4660130.1 uncharacterized protein (TIGR00255 family) [Parvularcula dongshanensis]
MSVRSMTGFAEGEGASGAFAWRWTLRAVNGKGFDLKLRLPPGFEAAEPALRKAQVSLSRGNVSATMKLERSEAASSLRVDQDALDAVVAAAMVARATAKEAGLKLAKTRPENLLGMGGSLRTGPEAEAPTEDDLAAVRASFAEAAAALAHDRAREGAVLAEALQNHLTEIDRLTGEAARLSEAAIPALRERLEQQVRALLEGELPKDRIAQEAALLAVKADVREETDRLHAHTEAARALLSEGGPIGRKLEFLAQEFAREATTLTTKASTTELKRVGLDLRHVIDQLREQVLNVE